MPADLPLAKPILDFLAKAVQMLSFGPFVVEETQLRIGNLIVPGSAGLASALHGLGVRSLSIPRPPRTGYRRIRKGLTLAFAEALRAGPAQGIPRLEGHDIRVNEPVPDKHGKLPIPSGPGPLVLFFPYGQSLGHTVRPLMIARELLDLGVRVVFAGTGPYMSFVEAEGFPVLECLDLNEDYGVEEFSEKGSASVLNRFSADVLFHADCRLVEDLRRKGVTIDAILADRRPTSATVAEYFEIPFVGIINAQWTRYYADWGVKDLPDSNFFARLIRAIPLLTMEKKRRILDKIVPVGIWVFCWFLASPLNWLRMKNRLPARPLHTLFAGEALTLLPDFPEFTPTQNLPATMHYTGPIVWEPDIPEPEWTSALTPQERTLYLSLGSSGNRELFFDVVAAFGDGPYQVIVTTGGMVGPDEIERITLPSNVHVAQFSKGSALARRADVVISHFGSGTLFQALAEGVPMVGVAYNVDQERNMVWAESKGVGRGLLKRVYTAKRLYALVEEVLADPAYREGARRFREVIDGYRGPKRSAELIAAFVRDRR